MKKLLMLFLVAATALSCSDDDNNSTSAPSIVGTWKLTGFYNGTTPVSASECMQNNKLVLNADFTAQQTMASESVSGSCTTATFGGIYVVSGNTLTITTAAMQPGFEIVSLTSTKLRLSSIDGGGDTPDVEYTRQ